MPGTATQPRLTAARPRIAIRGQDNPSLAEGLLALRLHESVDGQAACEAAFGNWGAKDNRTTFLYFDRAVLDFGKEITITIGPDGDVLFRGRISGLEAGFPEGGGPRLTVLAEDRHADLRMTRRTRSFADVSDADVFTKIASEHGLSADVQLTGPTYRILTQLNQSDLAFLRDRARAVDAELWMEGNTLMARTRTGRAAATPLRMGYGNELREFTVLADLAGQRSSVTVSGWDVAAKQALAETAEEAAVSGELAGGLSAAQILAMAFGKCDEHVVHSVPLTGAEAKARADTAYKRIARRFLTARGVAETSGALRVGAKVTIDHLGDLFSGTYYVSEVTHRFDDEQGLRTEFLAERAGLGGSA
jgi:phage protein D